MKSGYSWVVHFSGLLLYASGWWVGCRSDWCLKGKSLKKQERCDDFVNEQSTPLKITWNSKTSWWLPEKMHMILEKVISLRWKDSAIKGDLKCLSVGLASWLNISILKLLIVGSFPPCFGLSQPYLCSNVSLTIPSFSSKIPLDHWWFVLDFLSGCSYSYFGIHWWKKSCTSWYRVPGMVYIYIYVQNIIFILKTLRYSAICIYIYIIDIYNIYIYHYIIINI